VIGTDPKRRLLQRRRTDGVDDAPLSIPIGLRCSGRIQAGWYARIWPREIRTDPRPCLRTVRRLEQVLIGVIHGARIGALEHERLRPIGARVFALGNSRLRVAAHRDVTLQVPSLASAAKENARMLWIARRI